MSDNQQECSFFMDLALEQAKMALEADEVPVGCVVAQNGSIICRSHNLANALSDPLAHAEYLSVRSLVESGKDLSNLVFYITIEPCAMCAGVLERIGAKAVYGYENSIFGATRLLGKRPGVCLHDERCIDILKKFYTTENKSTTHLKHRGKDHCSGDFLD